jgi:hypothetical protein
LTTMMAFYIAVLYSTEKKHREALVLARHAQSEAAHCAEFAAKSFRAGKPDRLG